MQPAPDIAFTEESATQLRFIKQTSRATTEAVILCVNSHQGKQGTEITKQCVESLTWQSAEASTIN